MPIFLSLHTIAARRGDGLHPELLKAMSCPHTAKSGTGRLPDSGAPLQMAHTSRMRNGWTVHERADTNSTASKQANRDRAPLPSEERI